VGEVLRGGAAVLRAAGVPDPDRDAEWFLGAALGLSRGRLHLASDGVVPWAAGRRFAAWCARRARREPLQYVLGSQPFRTVELLVDRRVLVPRPETERLVDLCLTLYRGGPILEIGTGSGAIAISLAVECADGVVFATDVVAPALVLARENARRAGMQRIYFACGDLFDPFGPRVRECQLVVCNPPYVAKKDLETLAPEVRDFEPRIALDGGDDGLGVYRRLAPAAARMMGGGAWIALEIGMGQRPAVEALFGATGVFEGAVAIRDNSGIERGLALRRRSRC
jgi:release factor glutamine methyltransferase